MTDAEFDAALVAAAFSQGAEDGWGKVSPAGAALRAGLELPLARARFPSRRAILEKFGALADAHALTGRPTDGLAREKLFDLLMRRFDFLQLHRAGMSALLRGLPLDPALAIYLGNATLTSMGWMLEAAGIPAAGAGGAVAKRGLLGVWLWGLNAWMRDEGDDLPGTMAAVDKMLGRADDLAHRLPFLPRAADETADDVTTVEPPFAAEPPIVL